MNAKGAEDALEEQFWNVRAKLGVILGFQVEWGHLYYGNEEWENRIEPLVVGRTVLNILKMCFMEHLNHADHLHMFIDSKSVQTRPSRKSVPQVTATTEDWFWVNSFFSVVDEDENDG